MFSRLRVSLHGREAFEAVAVGYFCYQMAGRNFIFLLFFLPAAPRLVNIGVTFVGPFCLARSKFNARFAPRSMRGSSQAECSA
jgi:hypothetical protein